MTKHFIIVTGIWIMLNKTIIISRRDSLFWFDFFLNEKPTKITRVTQKKESRGSYGFEGKSRFHFYSFWYIGNKKYFGLVVVRDTRCCIKCELRENVLDGSL